MHRKPPQFTSLKLKFRQIAGDCGVGTYKIGFYTKFGNYGHWNYVDVGLRRKVRVFFQRKFPKILWPIHKFHVINNSKQLFLDQMKLFHKVHTSNYHFRAKKVLFLTEKWVYGGFFIGQDFSRNYLPDYTFLRFEMSVLCNHKL